MTRIRACKAAVVFLFVLQCVVPLLPALAEIHPLSGITDPDGSGIQDVDITISLDWDPSTLTGAEPDPRGLTQAEFQQVMDGFAQSLFAMTNGLHRLRNVYVFKNKAYWDMADIRYISTQAGRSAAHVSFWKKKGGMINMFVYEDFAGGVYTRDAYPGPVLAHECGHYIYGVYDEYQEAGGKSRVQLKAENKLWMPAGDDDGTQPSIMNQHFNYPNWFSVEENYGSAVLKNTAQYRMFGKSIWSTIASDPAADHANARDDQRTWFDAFKGKRVLKAADLRAHQTDPLTGYNNKLNIVWMTTDVHTVLVLDSSMPAASWSPARKGAAAGIREMKAGNWVTVMQGESRIVDRTQVTTANKPALATEVESLAQGTSTSVEASLRAALAEVVRQKTQTGLNVTSNVYLMTSGNPAVPSSLIKAFANARAMLTVASFSQAAREEPAAGYITVNDLAGFSGGKTNMAGKALALKSGVARTINLMEDDRVSDIAAELHADGLDAGSAHTLHFTAGPKDEELEIVMFADEDEWDAITPTLIDPTGHVLSIASPASGFSAEIDSEAGLLIFRIDTSLYAGATGQWSAVMTAVSRISEPLFIVASAVSDLTLEVLVRESPLYGYVAQASLSAGRPVLGARVAAVVYDTEGNVRQTLEMKDDGLNGDIRVEDGIYSARITPYLADGEYYIVVQADDNGGRAIESDRSMSFGASSETIETSTGAFERTDENAFNFFLSRSSGSGSSGGWCFIAEAAYGSWLDSHVGTLRHFRDRWLLTSGPGRFLVRFYYRWSPDAAAFIRKHETARHAARMVLTPVVYSIRYPLFPVAALVIMILYWNRRRWMPFVRGK